MVSSPVRPWGRSINPVIRARSFAAAGALAASNWKPSDGNYADALASIVKEAGAGLVSWQDPSFSEIISSTPFDEGVLADAWTEAFVAKTAKADPNPIARIAVTPQSFGGMRLEEGFISTYQKLLFPWLNRMDDDQPGQIAALSFTGFGEAKPHDWNWPLRVGLSPGMQSLAERLNTIRGVRREFIELVPATEATPDVLLSGWVPVAGAHMEDLAPGLAILYASRGIDGGMIDEIASQVSTPTAMIDMSTKSMPRFLNEFTDEIAHNKPLDVALFDAYRTIFNPKEGRTGDLPPLVLLTPKSNQENAFEGVKVENRVRDLVNRLDGLPKGLVIGSPTRGSKRLGIETSARTVDDYLTHLSKALDEENLDFSREIFGSRVLRTTTKAVDKVEAQLSSDAAGDASSAETGASSSAAEPGAQQPPSGEPSPPTSEPFSAYPRLDTPDEVRAENDFDIEVGFSDVPDPRAEKQQKITISEARKDEDLLVVVSAENGRIIEPNYAQLKLRLDARAKFSVRPAADADFVRLSVNYLFRNNPVGSIVRSVAIAGRKQAEPDDPEIADLFRPTLTAVDGASLDLVLLIKREGGTQITWQAVAGENISKQYSVDIGDARQFASQLDTLQRGSSYKGQSHNTVRGIGQTIADLIPQDILKGFLTPCLKGSKTPPRILILTNEPYVPWELALLDVDITGLDDVKYLGAIARIGRWWVAPRMAAPQTELTIGKISVVCADTYEIASGKKQLPQAIAERNWLKDKYMGSVVPVQGTLQPVLDWINTLPIGSGHLAHLALHGYSNPAANEQVLILGDGKNVSPYDLSGIRRINATPRYGMVFLNACQVGTAALTLGQFAGFPGALLQAGTNAVVGPIWEVNDEAAHALVINFYENALDQRIPVSETLRQIRAGCSIDATTTPLAYIFYGHPDLTLQK
jgi:hypothetical protein